MLLMARGRPLPAWASLPARLKNHSSTKQNPGNAGNGQAIGGLGYQSSPWLPLVNPGAPMQSVKSKAALYSCVHVQELPRGFNSSEQMLFETETCFATWKNNIYKKKTPKHPKHLRVSLDISWLMHLVAPPWNISSMGSSSHGWIEHQQNVKAMSKHQAVQYPTCKPSISISIWPQSPPKIFRRSSIFGHLTHRVMLGSGAKLRHDGNVIWRLLPWHWDWKPAPVTQAPPPQKNVGFMKSLFDIYQPTTTTV